MEWDSWWQSLEQPTRNTITLAQKKGRRLRAATEHEPPQLFVESRWVYRAYTELGRDGYSGALRPESMFAVLDEYGITDPAERFEARQIWREMAAKERELRDAKAPIRAGRPGGEA